MKRSLLLLALTALLSTTLVFADDGKDKKSEAGTYDQQRGNIVLAPVRLGVGLRAGASIGYVHYTPKKTYNPF
jgi:hypothetical protein